MSSTTESQIKYAGNGVQVLFTFPFTYLQPTDIYVSLYNQTERRWDDTTQWTFANATTIQFTTAPPTATGEVTDNIRIQRRTSIDPLVAQFNPGSAIRAGDLNDDFEQLQLAIIDNSSAVNNLDVGVTSLTTAGDGLSVDQSTGNITISNTGVTAVNGGTGVSVNQTTGNTTISNTGVTEITAGDGISIDQSTGNVTITSTKVSDVTSVNGQTGDVSLDINDLTDVDTESPGHVPRDGQALTWDAGMNHWMPASVVAEGAVPEAPEDNKVYGRENATWVVIADGETGPVLSVNNQTGAVRIGVEELIDFAYYPESGQVTLVGPNVADLASEPNPTEAEYEAGINVSDELWILYLATNTAQNAVFEQLSEGDEVTACYYVQHQQTGDPVYIEVACTFKEFTTNSGSDPLESWLILTGNFTNSIPMIGDYSMVIKSPFISNGFKPITTGQAIVYDQTTATWRPEDVTLNISSYPTLPSN